MMGLDTKYRSIGILGARTGAGPQIFAADEAVKATNCEILTIELARDTKGGAGLVPLIVFGAEDVSDARRAVESPWANWIAPSATCTATTRGTSSFSTPPAPARP